MVSRGAASILLMMVSLQALLLLLVAAGASSVSGGTSIRLPSDADARAATAGVADDLVRAKPQQGDEKRPWECCNLAICALTEPPICRCMDHVERCSDACKNCQEIMEDDDSLHYCADTYRGEPGPRCKNDEHANGRRGGVMANDRKARHDDEVEESGGGDHHDWARRLRLAARGHRF